MKRTISMALLALALLPATAHAQDASTAVSVPLMLPASDSVRQSFVRLINESSEAGSVRIIAVDDGGNEADPITVSLAANSVLHFNSGDLTDGNARKGINEGIGSPRQGSWRLRVETALNVQVLSFIRTRDGFLTPMHDVLPRDLQGRLLARTFNPGSNRDQRSSLRLVNTGTGSEQVSISGVDDAGSIAGPVTLTLPAGQSRTLSALDLEEGARNVEGTLGDGTGKWQLLITASQALVGMSLLETPSGHVTSLSTTGVPAAEDEGNPLSGGGPQNPTGLPLNREQSIRISAGSTAWFRISAPNSGHLGVVVDDLDGRDCRRADKNFYRADGSGVRFQAHGVRVAVTSDYVDLYNYSPDDPYFLGSPPFLTRGETFLMRVVVSSSTPCEGTIEAVFLPAVNLALNGQRSVRADPPTPWEDPPYSWRRHLFKLGQVSAAGTLTVYSTGNADTDASLIGALRDSGEPTFWVRDNSSGGFGHFRITREIRGGENLFLWTGAVGSVRDYTVHAEYTPN